MCFSLLMCLLYYTDDSDTVVQETISFDAICQFQASLVNVPNGFCRFENCFTDKSGNGVVRVYFSADSFHWSEHKSIIITLFPDKKHKHLLILQGQTMPISIIRYKLKIEEENQQQYIWYKDEGGKDKCVELKVYLVDKYGNDIKNRKVPLKLTLVYAAKAVPGSDILVNQKVGDQNLLAINSESHMMIDDKPATIKLRINEVSNRHQGQLFQVQISPDIDHSHSLIDIAAETLSIPVDVKSKRNHHKDKAAGDNNSRADTSSDPSAKKTKIGEYYTTWKSTMTTSECYYWYYDLLLLSLLLLLPLLLLLSLALPLLLQLLLLYCVNVIGCWYG